jgi:hypothetical protein
LRPAAQAASSAHSPPDGSGPSWQVSPQLRQAVDPPQYGLLAQQPPCPKLWVQAWFQQPPKQIPVGSPGEWLHLASEQQSPSSKHSWIAPPAAGAHCVEQEQLTDGGDPTDGPGPLVTWRNGAAAQQPWAQSQGAATQLSP